MDMGSHSFFGPRFCKSAYEPLLQLAGKVLRWLDKATGRLIFLSVELSLFLFSFVVEVGLQIVAVC
jgi:hypothetical protein